MEFSIMYIYHYAKYCSNVDMERTIADIRKYNLELLINESGLRKGKFADKIDTAPAYISQILSTKTKRDMGNELARKIELIVNKPYGWMDETHYEDLEQKTADPLVEAIEKLSEADRLMIFRVVSSLTGNSTIQDISKTIAAPIHELPKPLKPPAQADQKPPTLPITGSYRGMPVNLESLDYNPDHDGGMRLPRIDGESYEDAKSRLDARQTQRRINIGERRKEKVAAQALEESHKPEIGKTWEQMADSYTFRHKRHDDQIVDSQNNEEDEE
jgi:hypothetical protein